VIRIVADSSPLISLATAGHLQLLRHVADEVCVPDQVWTECVLHGAGRPGAEEISQAGWIVRLTVADPSYVQQLHQELDLGESEAIALARQLATPMLIDERRGRAVASREGVTVIGTAGLLLRLKNESVIPAVRPVAEELITAGWRVGGELLQAILTASGEADG
jgi:predicted nucleic acid-binding protein